ncbi:MAG: tol-pal system protein YbgF [Thermodesulfobacteriota bacterium]|nr:tol-pal system protein YbgF [Thermodesulfobacteriota bacterium]
MNARIVTGKAVLLFILVVIVGGCAMQEDVAVVNNRYVALKRKVVTENREAAADRDVLRSELEKCRQDQAQFDDVYRTKHAELNALMKDLRGEIQEVGGRLEENRHEAQQGLDGLAEWKAKQEDQSYRLASEAEGNLERIVRLEQYLGLEPSETLASSETEETKAGPKKAGGKPTSEELYKDAKQKFDQGAYEEARGLFQSFLEGYPQSDKADSARFWIGEIYYRDKWYEKAILEYQRVIEDHPKGNKVPSALLKQGFAFSNLGDTDNAKLILKELVRKYPESNEARIAQKKLKTF